MIDKNPINPLCKLKSPKRIASFDVHQIISQYNQMNIDVKRFFAGHDTIDLYQCSETGYRFYYPFSTIGDADFYKDLSLNRKNYYSTRWEHNKILPHLSSDEKILEIGSGFGAFLALLKSKSIEVEGIELNPEAVKKCKQDGYKIHDVLIGEFAGKNNEVYDVVCFFQVLEHIVNVHDFLKSSLDTLKPNGRLIIGVPNNNPFLFVNDKYHTLNLPPHHAGLWDKMSLKALEKVFSIKLESVYIEPLEKSYSEFIKAYMKNSSFVYAKILRVFNKVAPKLLKRILCKYIKGRNILAVFRKTM